MFGEQLAEVPDLNSSIEQLRNDIKNGKFKSEDYELMEELVEKFEFMDDKYKNEWKKYTKITKKEYDEKFKIDKKLKVNRKIYNPGKFNVYYDKYMCWKE